ncbi:hypothetical protein BXU09_11820 [Deinococcus sp. LM3]|nr:hypothetical protein BXU09_11820 [Deinococcus sp. LM3]
MQGHPDARRGELTGPDVPGGAGILQGAAQVFGVPFVTAKEGQPRGPDAQGRGMFAVAEHQGQGVRVGGQGVPLHSSLFAGMPSRDRYTRAADRPHSVTRPASTMPDCRATSSATRCAAGAGVPAAVASSSAHRAALPVGRVRA